MKNLTLSVVTIALLGTITVAMSMDINTQLEAISVAPDAERVELVNELKAELQTMTPEQRQEVMPSVRAEIGAQDGMGEGQGDMLRTRSEMREQAQSANADGMQQMQGSQMASQRRAEAGIDMPTSGMPANVGASTQTTGKMFGRR